MTGVIYHDTNPANKLVGELAHPINIANVPKAEPKHPPKLGEHSEEILRELGYDTAAIDVLRERGVI